MWKPKLCAVYLAISLILFQLQESSNAERVEWLPGDTFPDRRTPMCERTLQVQRGELALEEALQGLHLNMVATAGYNDQRFREEEDGMQTGHQTELLREIAARAGFTYTLYSMDVRELPDSGWTWSEVLLNQTSSFDVAVGEWLVNGDRLARGVRCPYAFLDNRLTLTKHVEPPKESTLAEDLGRWLEPFTVGLWATFLGVTFVTAALYYFLEAHRNEEDLGHPDRGTLPRVCDAQCMGLYLFTQAGGFTPSSGCGKLLVLTYSLVVLLLVTAYTANLAAGLVQNNQVDACLSLSSCLSRGSSVCVVRSTPFEEWLLDPTNKYAYLRPPKLVSTSGDPFAGIIDGSCDMVLEGFEDTKLALRRQEVNGDCTLSILDRDLLSLASGWMGSTDHQNYCTSLILDALSIHFIRMEVDGILSRLATEYVESRATQASCTKDSTSDIQQQWDIRSMLGGLSIHVLCMILVSLRAFLLHWHPTCHIPIMAAFGGKKYQDRHADLKAAKATPGGATGTEARVTITVEATTEISKKDAANNDKGKDFSVHFEEVQQKLDCLRRQWETETGCSLRKRTSVESSSDTIESF
mmetsp:Transcript_9118/g.20291  ORF Transcript_9118/g.20291 Transcript_9118/m.20291 type:complete len:581 (-) Transcript_9118:58-1800(-)